MRSHKGLLFAFGSVLVLFGCGTSSPKSAPLGGALTVTGQVIDFQTSMPVSGAVMLSTTGLQPEPMIQENGSSFTIPDVPDNSAFTILASQPPTYRATYSPQTVITTSDVSNVRAYTVAESFISAMQSGFGVTASAQNGILLLHLVDGSGAPQAGIAGSNIAIANAPSAPHFLDATLNPTTGTSSTSSGWVVFFDVTPGPATLAQAANATVTLQMATSPVAAGTVTIADLVVVANQPPPKPPTNISFSQQIVPIFSARGCTACHSGGGIGKNLGDLMLDSGPNHTYAQLTDPAHPMRIDLAMPEKSLVLTMPSYENPPDAHPNVTFTGPQDADYVKLLTWIREGAKNN
jgi:hypothetical protein